MLIRLRHCGPSSPIKRVKQVATRNLAAGKLQRVALSEFEDTHWVRRGNIAVQQDGAWLPRNQLVSMSRHAHSV